MSGGPHPPACPVCQADVHPAMWRRYEACIVDHGLVMEARADAAAATADEVRVRELLDQARGEVDRLRAALERYADPENWTEDDGRICERVVWRADDFAAGKDGGETARAALVLDG